MSSDGGALLLRTVDRGLGISRALSRCFSDRRDQRFVEFSVQELLAQRLYGLALGYEDLNDHTALRRDPLLAVAVDRADPLGAERVRAQQGNGLASASTLNRLELGAQEQEGHYRKINVAPEQVEAALLEMGVRSLPRKTRLVVLDFDATDDPLHGAQEGRFFHGYYGHYCYLPLFCFAGSAVLWAQLRTSDRDGSDGTVEALEKIVAALRRRFGRKLRIVVRGDSGFAREAIMAWCEAQRQTVFYCLGLARNGRLEEALEQAFMRARARHALCGGASVREFADLRWRTIDSWSRERRVIGKAEVTAQGDNPRFIVTNLPLKAWADLRAEDGPGRFADAAAIYERLYCERGNAENQIKQMTLDLHADRLSTHWLASNQMRLWLSSFAYLLLERLRGVGLAGTKLARAALGSVRQKLLKIAAWVRVSVRRISVKLASTHGWRAEFGMAVAAMRRAWPESA